MEDVRGMHRGGMTALKQGNFARADKLKAQVVAAFSNSKFTCLRGLVIRILAVGASATIDKKGTAGLVKIPAIAPIVASENCQFPNLAHSVFPQGDSSLHVAVHKQFDRAWRGTGTGRYTRGRHRSDRLSAPRF